VKAKGTSNQGRAALERRGRGYSGFYDNYTPAGATKIVAVDVLPDMDVPSVAAVDVDGKLLVVWQAGDRGGLRMRMGEPDKLARAASVVVLDDRQIPMNDNDAMCAGPIANMEIAEPTRAGETPLVYGVGTLGNTSLTRTLIGRASSGYRDHASTAPSSEGAVNLSGSKHKCLDFVEEAHAGAKEKIVVVTTRYGDEVRLRQSGSNLLSHGIRNNFVFLSV
jgi:hypothetical protein